MLSPTKPLHPPRWQQARAYEYLLTLSDLDDPFSMPRPNAKKAPTGIVWVGETRGCLLAKVSVNTRSPCARGPVPKRRWKGQTLFFGFSCDRSPLEQVLSTLTTGMG